MCVRNNRDIEFIVKFETSSHDCHKDREDGCETCLHYNELTNGLSKEARLRIDTRIKQETQEVECYDCMDSGYIEEGEFDNVYSVSCHCQKNVDVYDPLENNLQLI